MTIHFVCNGLTDVLIDYLLLSGSKLSATESEKRMIAFLAEKQQLKILKNSSDIYVGYMI